MRDLRARIGHDVLRQAGAAAVIVNAAGQVLRQRRSDNGEWGLPGGLMEPGEEPAETLAPDAPPAMPPRHGMRIRDALRNEPRARFRSIVSPSAAPPRRA